MGLKDNFFQAMKELFGGESAGADVSAEKEAKDPESQLFTREEPEQPSQPAKAAESGPFNDMSLESQFEDRMRDMLKSSGLVGADLQAQAQSSTDLDSNLKKAETPVSKPAQAPAYSAPVQSAPTMQPPTFAREPEPSRPAPSYTQPAYTQPVRTAPSFTTAPSFAKEPAVEPLHYSAPTSESAYSAPSQTRFTSPYGQAEQETFPRSSTTGAEVTIISKNTLVTGNIRSFAGIYVEGNVSGNIEVVKNADINGKIIGNITCSDTRLNGALVQGDILSKGRVFMDKNAMLVGNMAGQSMDVDGKVKGNVEVGGRIGLRENSVVIGNINAGTIAIADGANVQGYINTTYLRENADKVFPAQISLADEESAFSQPRQ